MIIHPRSLEMQIIVIPEDIDRLGHVNNVVYVRWIQDLAIAHWRRDALPKDQEDVYWVVQRHEIDYKRPAVLGDEIMGKTWVGKASKRSFQRYTELVRAVDQKTLASALTYWCPIDRMTLKPTDVNTAVRERFSDG